MDHVSEEELAGWKDLPAKRRADIEAHLLSCSACRSIWEAQMQLWSLMDAWQPPAAPDLGSAIVRRIAHEKSAPRYWKPLVGIAAAMAISSGVGYLAGILARPQTQVAASADQAAAELHLDDLTASAAGELQNLFSISPENTSREVPG